MPYRTQQQPQQAIPDHLILWSLPILERDFDDSDYELALQAEQFAATEE